MQLAGRERQPGHHRVHPVVEQGGVRFVPGQVQGVHVGIEMLFARIGELFSDRSVLLISHRFSTVRSADRIYVLNEGFVVESGTHEELVAAGGTYAELFALQASPYQ